MIIQIVLIIVGFALLIKGADLLVDGSKVIAKKFNISEINHTNFQKLLLEYAVYLQPREC